jgi:hypothetical protein
MRNFLFLLLFSSFYTNLPGATTSTPIPYGSTLNFVVNLNNVQEARATNSNTLTNPCVSESPLLDKLSQIWVDPHTNQNLVKRISGNTSSLVNDYKWPLALGTLISGYAYMCYIIASGNSYLAQKDLWSSWRQELTLEQLLTIPQPQFAKELLQEIQRRYTDPAAVTDIVRPLGTFMKMIEEEEQQLLWYQNTFSWLQYTKVISIIPLNKTQFTKISEKLQRLIYFKNAFQSWAAHYQLEQVSKALSLNNEEDIPNVRPMAALMNYHYKISALQHFAKRYARITPYA